MSSKSRDNQQVNKTPYIEISPILKKKISTPITNQVHISVWKPPINGPIKIQWKAIKEIMIPDDDEVSEV